MKTTFSEIEHLEMRIARRKTAGWDYIKTDKDVMEVLKENYKNVKWLMKNEDGVYGVIEDDYVVALYKTEALPNRSGKKEDHLMVKVIEGSAGPYQRPPRKFWELPEVKRALSEERLKFERDNSRSWLQRGERVAAMTFAQAQAKIREALKSEGWKVKEGLKIPYAEKDDVRVWFKPQAIWYSVGKHSLQDARSLWVDAKKLAEKPANAISKQLMDSASLNDDEEEHRAMLRTEKGASHK